MKPLIFEATHQGARANNQDYCSHLVTELWSLFIVADGLGGHENGEVAAKEFCDACVACASAFAIKMQKNPHETMLAFIQHSAKLMCVNISKKYGLLDTQTVFALAWITEKNVVTAHIGDTRVYRLSSNSIWRTPDHTFVQQLFEQQQITEEDFGIHPLQNRLIKSLNTFDIPQADVFVQGTLKSDETLLLCSDGFWSRLNSQDLNTIAMSSNLPATIQNKIAEILANFSAVSDNITVQTVRVL